VSIYLFVDESESHRPPADQNLMLRYWDTEQCRFIVEPMPLADATAWERDAMTVRHTVLGH
jgi:hypothetical protein